MSRPINILSFLWLGAFLIAGAFLHPVYAGTWRVEQDGSGDFTEIQPAVDVAASGDTILIGPGIYNELHEIQVPAWGLPTKVIVSLDVEGLVFIGAGMDQVFLGLDEYDPSNMGIMIGPIGIMGGSLSEAWSVEGVTFRNMFNGIYTYGILSSNHCRFQSNEGAGIRTFSDQGLTVDSCTFEGGDGDAVWTSGCIGQVSVTNSEFLECSCSYKGSRNVLVSDCTFFGGGPSSGRNGIKFDNSQGIVRSCRGEGFGLMAVEALANSEMLIVDSYFQSNGGSLASGFGSSVIVENSVLVGANRATITIYSGSQASVGSSHIIKTNNNYILCHDDVVPPIELDFRGNFWGTTDLDTIAAHIWDHNDDPDVPVSIVFEPISDVPLPVEGQEKSFGGFKAMFR